MIGFLVFQLRMKKIFAYQKNFFNNFSKSPSSFQTFLDFNWSKIIKAGFVFQIQPYHFRYKPFVVFIRPSPNGKASAEIVDLLYKIRNLANNLRILIKSFAFDGDSSYRHLHYNYFKSYFNRLILVNRFIDFKLNVIGVVSDFLHLIKRLRYRLLSSIIHSGFNLESVPIEIDDLKLILKEMCQVVWCNEKYIKKNDNLPMELFKTEISLKLIKTEHFSATGYWFPITVSMRTLYNENIEFKYRNSFLQCSLFFMLYYYNMWTNGNIELRQRKYGNEKDVFFYTKELMIEFSNTIYANLQIMNNINNYHFSSNLVMPELNQMI